MLVRADRLQRLVSTIFEMAGCSKSEAECIAARLVESNLVGHDSHGVIRVPTYINWLLDGKVVANQHLKVIWESGSLVITDGQLGFGQTIGTEAMELAIARAKALGVAVVALRNSGHLGRIGDWAEMAVAAGLLSLHFVNTSGGGILAAPFGGTERRLSANPIAAGIPVPGGTPMILDMSTCAIAEGKIKVALNKGVPVPANCIVDAAGRPTTSPREFYGPPPGAILPLGGHKGYGLSLLAEVMAGALTGGSCSNPKEKRVVNNMLTIALDPFRMQPEVEFVAEIHRFFEFVKSSARSAPGGDILIPGEPEARTKAERGQNGIDIDPATWDQIVQTCDSLGIVASSIDSILRG